MSDGARRRSRGGRPNPCTLLGNGVVTGNRKSDLGRLVEFAAPSPDLHHARRAANRPLPTCAGPTSWPARERGSKETSCEATAKLPAMEPSVYKFPSIFRRVHMEQPGEIVQETDFLQQVWRRHLKKPVRRVLDIASGDSPHGQILAREGARVVGVDRSPTMIAAGKAES